MIKKVFHYIFVMLFGTILCLLLAVVLRYAFLAIYHVDIFDVETFYRFAEYWNSGGVLHGKDLLMVGSLLVYFPLCMVLFKLLNRCQFINLITVPLSKIVNAGLDNYEVPNINIKNLKIEEKKNLEQVVQERIAIEKKKQAQMRDTAPNIRQEIIKKLEEE